MALDVGDTAQVYAAFLVYLDLLEERRWQEVTSRGSAELQLVYLEGRESESQPRQLIVPLPGQRSLSHQGVRSLLSQPGSDGAPSPSLLLAAVAPDSTLAYYRFSRGFVVPEPPDSIQALECGRERRKRRRL
ncbi:tRNA-splicing endonuclease subunit Sen15 [Acipenser ruthenus]|uniref:tRNA-splicing endonuclease subunit Sen15 n=2 Tax=Acipenser ruthenus TaxID=7906 RepID=A0A444V160_ACIRT|nr:tRNA-splicing endonuclease subunit Sen15 [Acipenser ruthenus]